MIRLLSILFILIGLTLKSYSYDQLYRLTGMTVYGSGDVLTSNDWINSGYRSESGSYASSAQVSSYYTSYKYDENGNLLRLIRNKQSIGNGDYEMDDIRYLYHKTYDALSSEYSLNSNRLYHVYDAHGGRSYENRDIVGDVDPIGLSGYQEEILENNEILMSLGITDEQSGAQNFGYDELGNLVQDRESRIEEIVYNSSRKIKSITRYIDSPLPDLEFFYDVYGRRIGKLIKPKVPTSNFVDFTLSSPSNWKLETYALSSEGQQVAVYSHEVGSLSGSVEGLNQLVLSSTKLKDNSILASGRLGVVKRNISLKDPIVYALNTLNKEYYDDYLSRRYYELTNHLGSVMTVVSDKKLTQRNTVMKGDGNMDYVK